MVIGVIFKKIKTEYIINNCTLNSLVNYNNKLNSFHAINMLKIPHVDNKLKIILHKADYNYLFLVCTTFTSKPIEKIMDITSQEHPSLLFTNNITHTVPLKSKLPLSRETRLISLETRLERNKTSLV